MSNDLPNYLDYLYSQVKADATNEQELFSWLRLLDAMKVKDVANPPVAVDVGADITMRLQDQTQVRVGHIPEMGVADDSYSVSISGPLKLKPGSATESNAVQFQ